ncbi:MAG TPA: NADH-quinone oxidoreductase subunit NuoE, partial [Elusimicrobia bacterium]|nr:NADH-quinone oxidoreductase subunit NuoE [Elusimicrobiota bacterium]
KYKNLQRSFSESSKKREIVIPILQELQELYNYLPEGTLRIIATELNLPLSKIYGVATFYAQFTFTPRGKNLIRLCTGTACHVRGGKRILQTAERILELKDGETSKDFKFTLQTVRCLGTCFLAPVMMINHEYFGRLTTQKIETVLKEYE